MAKVEFLRCVKCGRRFAADAVEYFCPSCGPEGTLDVLYDYNQIKPQFTKESLKSKEELSLWRYIDLLPVRCKPDLLNMQVGYTPLYKAARVEKEFGMSHV
ncbi:MAG: threonine synthase, partial [Clostridia bacterium]|nr:threonine synthase [Clostridia bacterium]